MSVRLRIRPSALWLDGARRASFRVSAIALLSFASSGCSFLFVKTPPAKTISRHVQCTSSRLAPGFDSAFAGFQVVRTGLAIGAPDSTYQNARLSRGADIGLGLGFTALFVSSAIYGFANTAQCSRLNGPVEDANESEDPRQPPETWSSTRSPATAPPPRATPAPSAPAPSAPTPAASTLAPSATPSAPTPASSTPAPSATPATPATPAPASSTSASSISPASAAPSATPGTTMAPPVRRSGR